MSVEYAFVCSESALEANLRLARTSTHAAPEPALVDMLPEPDLCVSNARGLRALEKDVDLAKLGIVGRPVHLLVPYARSRSRCKDACFHVWEDILPDGAFFQVDDRVFVSSPAFTVLQATIACRPSKLSAAAARDLAEFDERFRAEHGLPPSSCTVDDYRKWDNTARIVRAARLLSMFAGTFIPGMREGEPTVYGTQPIISRSQMLSYIETFPHVKSNERGKRAIDLAFDGAASHMEIALALMLTLPTEYGGFGLPRPTLNETIAADGVLRVVSPQDEMRGDLVWKRSGLIVEYNSREFHDHRLALDAQRANALTAMGWKVLWVARDQVTSLEMLALLAQQIAHLTDVRLDDPDDALLMRRARLHAMLMPNVKNYS